MSEESSEKNGREWSGIWVLGAVPFLVFVPLLISLCEHVMLGSQHFEDLLRRIGVHHALGRIYEPVFELFR